MAAVSDDYLQFVLDQLAALGVVRARRMFGGAGLYRGDEFFGIVHGDALYFKVDETTRAEYERAGSEPFRPFANRATTLQYFLVPAEVLEDSGELCSWARRAVLVAQRVKDKPRRKK